MSAWWTRLQSNGQDEAAEPVFAYLLHPLWLYQPTRGQSNDVPAAFMVLWPQLRDMLDRLMPQLLRSFDPLAAHSDTGDSGLHRPPRACWP